jgi:hypothetical protein
MRNPSICLAITLALSCGACGSNPQRLDTRTVVSALHQAGFVHLKVFSNREAFEQLARKAHAPSEAAHAADIDTITTRPAADQPLRSPFLAIRYPSQADAEQGFRNNAPLLAGRLTREERALLPRGFRLSRLHLARVCNVLVFSYNPSRSARLSNRIERAVTLLRKRCS